VGYGENHAIWVAINFGVLDKGNRHTYAPSQHGSDFLALDSIELCVAELSTYANIEPATSPSTTFVSLRPSPHELCSPY